LQSHELATKLLEPLRLEQLTPTTAPRLVDLARAHGRAWAESLLARWSGERPSVDGVARLAWLRGLPRVVRALCDAEGTEGRALARSATTAQWAWVQERYRAAARGRPSTVLRECARLDAATLGLLEASLVCGDPELHAGVIGFLTSGRVPPIALVALLKTAPPARAVAGRARLDLGPLHAHATREIGARLEARVRAAGDWSIGPPAGCSCAPCQELGRFLSDPARTQWAWPLAEVGRRHVHGVIESHELPLRHGTRRSGRPYSLMLVKTSALFEREAKERAALQDALDWLTRHRHRFGGPNR
jgi:hypothetical protein